MAGSESLTAAQTDEPTQRRSRARREPSSYGLSGMWLSPSTMMTALLVASFLFLLAGVLGGVLVDSFATQWFSGLLPKGWTTSRYGEAWSRFELGHVIVVTLVVSLAVIAISVSAGVPAAYLLARSNFPGKRLVLGLFLLPLLMPPLTYGFQLATVMYNLGLGRTLLGVIIVNIVPAVPFVILTMVPFIEQINPSIENAARMCGANTRTVFLRVLVPLLAPGLLAASVLVFVRTVGLFELTFLVSGPDTDTLIVALYRSMTSAGGTISRQIISAISVVYSLTIAVILVLGLRFVSPTQLVTRVSTAK